jgi:hypothetical protein
LKDGFLSQEEYDKLKKQIIGTQNTLEVNNDTYTSKVEKSSYKLETINENNNANSDKYESKSHGLILFALITGVSFIIIFAVVFTHYQNSAVVNSPIDKQVSSDTVANPESPRPQIQSSNDIHAYDETSNTLDDFRNIEHSKPDITPIYSDTINTSSDNLNSNKDNTVATLAIGDSYGGGIIAHIYKTDEHGYIEGETHGFIMASRELFGTWNNAQKICDTLNINGVTHWQLPTLNELTMIYRNIQQLGGYESGSHGVWCSYQINQTSASVCSFDGHGAFVSLPKTSGFFIRPIKYF